MKLMIRTALASAIAVAMAASAMAASPTYGDGAKVPASGVQTGSSSPTGSTSSGGGGIQSGAQANNVTSRYLQGKTGATSSTGPQGATGAGTSAAGTSK